MNLPFDRISIETLMDKWGMSKMDIFQIVLNHQLLPVHSDHPDADWIEYSLEEAVYLFTWKEKYGNRSIIFRMSDIENLEGKLGSKLSKSSSIISEEELCKRWNISMIEIENLIENSKLDVVDPLNIKIKDFSELSPEHLALSPWYHSDGMTRYFRKTDVEGLEKAHDTEPNEGQMYDDDKIGNPKILDVLHEKHNIENNTGKRLELESYIKVAEEFLKKDLVGS
jgi:hypothetical protein